MATSSLTKTFYISSKTETENFLAMISDFQKEPQKPLKEVKVEEISNSQMKKIINAKLRNRK